MMPTAVMKPHSLPVDVTNVWILTGIVRISVVKKSDNRNSVHEKQRLILQMLTTFHHEWRNLPKCLPSSSAINHSSFVNTFGTSSKKLFINNKAMGRLISA